MLHHSHVNWFSLSKENGRGKSYFFVNEKIIVYMSDERKQVYDELYKLCEYNKLFLKVSVICIN